VRLVDPDGDETPMTELAVEEYDDLTDKDSEGIPSQWAYDKQLTNGVLKIWPAASDVQYYLKARAQVEVDDLDTSTDDLEFPKQYYRALKYTLARDIFFEYEHEANKITAESWLAIKNQINKESDRYKFEIAGLDSEEASITFDYIP
jgi:hypothetical protein